MNKAMVALVGVVALAAGLLPTVSDAHFKKCPKDSILHGTSCMDVYEASVFLVPDPNGMNAGLVNKIKKGKLKDASKLLEGGAVQLGLGGDDYAPCTDQGSGCGELFAVSLPGVIPSASITWFQAQRACANAGKHLPTSAEWQQAVVGTPDPFADDGATTCKTVAGGAVAAGSRSACTSTSGVHDMVGNLYEWTADLLPLSSASPGWGGFTNDDMGLSGAFVAAGGPGALLRGGGFGFGPNCGPYAVEVLEPFEDRPWLGFRCAR